MSVPRKPRVDDDDDLEDLDDVLDDFSPRPAPPKPPASASSGAGASTLTQPTPDDDLTDAFSAELEKELESLFKNLGTASSDDATEHEQLAALDAILAKGTTASAPSDPGDFQSRIRSTMNKLKESESDLKSSDPSAGGDSFESLLSQFRDLGLGDIPADASEDQLEGVLEGMMKQLMGKDVLYEPLKELYEKFPEYLEKHKDTMSPEDKKRFEAQTACIKQLLDEFESKTYDDSDPGSREKIVALMTELQAHGSPPEEIMGPLPPGFNMGADGLPEMPEGCNMN